MTTSRRIQYDLRRYELHLRFAGNNPSAIQETTRGLEEYIRKHRWSLSNSSQSLCSATLLSQGRHRVRNGLPSSVCRLFAEFAIHFIQSFQCLAGCPVYEIPSSDTIYNPLTISSLIRNIKIPSNKFRHHIFLQWIITERSSRLEQRLE